MPDSWIVRRNDTGRRHAASGEVGIVSEVDLRRNDFGRRERGQSFCFPSLQDTYVAAAAAMRRLQQGSTWSSSERTIVQSKLFKAGMRRSPEASATEHC